jgi:hypothetical protein
MLRKLMTFVAELEMSHDEPHNSSFCPRPVELIRSLPGVARLQSRQTLAGPQPPTQATLQSLPSRRTKTAPTAKIRRWFNKDSLRNAGEVVSSSADQDQPVTELAGNSLWTGYLPCHYFDYIFGTSTGG